MQEFVSHPVAKGWRQGWGHPAQQSGSRRAVSRLRGFPRHHNRIGELSMETKCYEAHSPNSDVPICGLHQKPLIEQSLPTADQNPQGLGKGVLRYHLTVLVCPVTKETVRRL